MLVMMGRMILFVERMDGNEGGEWVVDDGGRGEIAGVDLPQIYKLFLLLVRLREIERARPRRLEPLQVVSH
jgi:hypothetical protein